MVRGGLTALPVTTCERAGTGRERVTVDQHDITDLRVSAVTALRHDVRQDIRNGVRVMTFRYGVTGCTGVLDRLAGEGRLSCCRSPAGRDVDAGTARGGAPAPRDLASMHAHERGSLCA